MDIIEHQEEMKAEAAETVDWLADNALPCPFCGARPEVYLGDDGDYVIACPDCTDCGSLCFSSYDHVRLIQAWNRRA